MSLKNSLSQQVFLPLQNLQEAEAEAVLTYE